MVLSIGTALYLGIGITLSIPVAAAQTLPTVDLGYSVYSATAVNVSLPTLTNHGMLMMVDKQESGAYYNFSNIRYAAPPTGALRFKDPAAPLKDRSQTFNGSVSVACPQAAPPWVVDSFASLGVNASLLAFGPSPKPQTQDCLFLDVIAPVAVFNQSSHKRSKLAPVLVSIHGGGYIIGDKQTNYAPNGLLERGANGFVYVAMNYRVSHIFRLSNLMM